MPLETRRQVIGAGAGLTAFSVFGLPRAETAATASLDQFGSGLKAWLGAADAVNGGRASTIVVPPGVHRIDRASLNDKADGLVVLRAPVRFIFRPGATILFDYIDTPLFTFTEKAAGGFSGPSRFIFTGKTPTAGDLTRQQFAHASGFPMSSFIGGGTHELWSLVLANASDLRFESISLESAVPGCEDHLIPIAFNLKPPSLEQRASSNSITGVKLRDIQHGVLYVGQTSLRVKTVDVDRRGGLPRIGPGHAVYASGLAAQTNIDCHIDDITDGPAAINWPASRADNLATIAPKQSRRSSFTNIISRHPAGLIQTMQNCSDCTFEDWQWMTDDDAPPFAAAINIAGSNGRCAFRHFRVNAPHKTFMVVNTGGGELSNCVFDNFDVVSDFNLTGPPQGVFDLYGSRNRFTGIRLRPSSPIKTLGQAPYEIRHTQSVENEFSAILEGPYVSPSLLRTPGAGATNRVVITTGPR